MVKAILDAGSRFLLLALPDVAYSQRGKDMTPEEMERAGAHLIEVKNIELVPQKKAILFGATNGHGATMTIISERNLRREGYDVTTVCKHLPGLSQRKSLGKSDLPDDCGTGSAEYFWGFTFRTYDFSELRPGDIIVVVDIPLPVRVNLTFSAADEAIERIGELHERGIRTLLIDHPKRTITHYREAIERGAEVTFVLGVEEFCHYGSPDVYSRFWGRIGAICDRDPSVLPVEPEEVEQFEEMERLAAVVDDMKRRDFLSLLEVIRRDDRGDLVHQESAFQPPESCVNGNVSIVRRLNKDIRFKELDAACAINDTQYGVGINDDCSAVQVISYWKKLRPAEDNRTPALPVALRLPQHRSDRFGHDNALTIVLDNKDCNAASGLLDEIVGVLNSTRIKADTTLKSREDAIDYIASIFSEIPTPYFLTMHGWNHVETVLGNARILGMAAGGLTPEEQTLLDWAALFHDLGNGAVSYKDEYHLIVSGDDGGAEARDKHELYTVQILTEWNKEGRFKDIIMEDDLRIISDLCYRHRKRSSLPKDPDLRKLCSLLRVADALDKTRDRARYNDDGKPYSQIKDSLPEESVEHWEAQRAIDAIRLHMRREAIVFEFLVTDNEKSDFIIKDFCEELKPLKGTIPPWEVKVTLTPQ